MSSYKIQRENGITTCDGGGHPIRLGRNPQHQPGESSARRRAIALGKKGYLCEGEDHTYPIWIVFDADNPDRENVGEFESYIEAKACLADLLGRDMTEEATDGC